MDSFIKVDDPLLLLASQDALEVMIVLLSLRTNMTDGFLHAMESERAEKQFCPDLLQVTNIGNPPGSLFKVFVLHSKW